MIFKKYHPEEHKNGFFDKTNCFIIEVCFIQSHNYAGTELQQWRVRDMINKETDLIQRNT